MRIHSSSCTEAKSANIKPKGSTLKANSRPGITVRKVKVSVVVLPTLAKIFSTTMKVAIAAPNVSPSRRSGLLRSSILLRTAAPGSSIESRIAKDVSIAIYP